MPNDAPRDTSQADFIYLFDAPPPSAQAIVVHSEYDIAPYLSRFLLGWPCRRLPAGAAAPDIRLHSDGQSLSVSLAGGHGAGLEAVSQFDGVNRLADLLSHVAARRVGTLAELHASAVLIGGKLVLFVGPSMSGKSSLALQLGARGCRLFADDRLLVGPLAGAAAAPFGMALGLTPRVRHPPHPAAGAFFAEFVERHLVKAGGNVGFLPLAEEILAGFGETAPLGCLILPERRDGGGTSLRPAGSVAANRAVLEQMHAPQIAAANFLAAVRDLTADLPCWHLQYDDSAQAALAVKDMIAG